METLSELCRKESMQLYAAFCEDAVVGYCCAQLICDEAELLRLAVRQTARGRGIGRLLIQMLKRRLKALGAVVLFLEVRASNRPARALYTSEHFTEISVRRNYYGDEDGIVMRCVLQNEDLREPGAGLFL